MAIKVSGTTVIDDSRGLINIASVDATTATAITEAGVGGGGTHEFVASGAISTGDVVVLNSDGTVSVVEQTNRGSTAGPTTLADSGHVTAVYDSTNNRVVVAYNAYTSPRLGKVVVGILTENSIAFGTPVTFHTGEINRPDCVFDSTNNKVVIVFVDLDDSSSKQAVVATVSGNSVTVGSPVTYAAGAVTVQAITFDSNSGKVVVTARNASGYPSCIVGTVSGSSISFGTLVVAESVSYTPSSITFDSVNNKILMLYFSSSNSIAKGVVGTVSGTSISFGTPVQFDNSAPAANYTDAVFDPVTGKIAFMYQVSYSGPMKAQVATISGTSVSFGTAVDVVSDAKAWVQATLDTTNNKVCFTLDDAGDNNISFVSGTISGDTIVLDPVIQIHNSHAQNSTMGLTFDPTINRVFFIGSIYAKSYLINTTAFTNAASYIGIAAENIADTATGEVTIIGGVNEQTVNSYDLANASYDGVSFSLAGLGLYLSHVVFKPDGTKMYIAVDDNGEDVKEYDLSSAWDVSTASYVQRFILSSQIIYPFGLFFKPDGTKMYVSDPSSQDINEYSLSSAWNISTASYTQSFSVSGNISFNTGLFFKPDGTKMYVVDYIIRDVNEYSLSSAWDIATASYTQNFSISGQETLATGLFFDSSGSKMFITGQSGDDVNEYSLSSAWNISTASYIRNFSVASQASSPTGISFKPDGTKMYIVGSDTDTVYQYTTGTFGGFTTNSSYFVADDGSLTTTNNGRKVGKALSATELQVKTKLTGSEMNEYLGGLV